MKWGNNEFKMQIFSKIFWEKFFKQIMILFDNYQKKTLHNFFEKFSFSNFQTWNTIHWKFEEKMLLKKKKWNNLIEMKRICYLLIEVWISH